MRSQLAVIGAVARSADLRRLEAGFLVFSIGEWASWLAVIVFAFDRGGAAEAGLLGFLMAAPAIVVAPAAAIFGDRWPRARVLLGSYALQALAMVATAAALVAGPAWLAYAIAILAQTCIGLSRPAFTALLPEVVETPDELTAANVVSGTAEGAGALIGPLLAGGLLIAGGPPLVWLVCGAGATFAALALWPITRRPSLLVAAADPGGVAPGDGAPGTGAHAGSMLGDLARELTAGAAAIRADRRLIGILTILAAAIGLLGALGVFTVVIAIDLLGLDDGAVGLLSAASGLGALIGSALAVVLVGRERLGQPLLAATAMFGLSVALVGVVREEAVVVVAFVIGGIGWSFAYVAATTLTQRLAGDDVMTRVFGVSESVMSAAEAVGALLVPVLIGLLGPSNALIAAGLALPVIALAAAPTFLAADRAETALLRELRVIRAVPMFRPLSGPVLERLAADAVPMTTPAGADIVRSGDRGDRFYVVVSGRAAVHVGATATRTIGAGESFGEIALLHDIPRTATVTATEPTELLAIERDAFLAAMTGQPRSQAIADRIATQHLAHDPDPTLGG